MRAMCEHSDPLNMFADEKIEHPRKKMCAHAALVGDASHGGPYGTGEREEIAKA